MKIHQIKIDKQNCLYIEAKKKNNQIDGEKTVNKKKTLTILKILFTIWFFTNAYYSWSLGCSKYHLFAQSKQWIFHFVFWRRWGQLLWHTLTQHVGWTQKRKLCHSFISNDYMSIQSNETTQMKGNKKKEAIEWIRFSSSFFTFVFVIEIWNYVYHFKEQNMNPSVHNLSPSPSLIWWFNQESLFYLGVRFTRAKTNKKK